MRPGLWNKQAALLNQRLRQRQHELRVARPLAGAERLASLCLADLGQWQEEGMSLLCGRKIALWAERGDLFARLAFQRHAKRIPNRCAKQAPDELLLLIRQRFLLLR